MAPDNPQASPGSATDPTAQPSSSGAASASASTSSALPHRPPLEKILLERYTNRDLLHTAAILSDQDNRSARYAVVNKEIDDYKKVRNEYRQWFPPSHLYGMGYSGYGNGHTDGPTRILYPTAKPRLGHRKTGKLRVKRKDMAKQADQVEELVPVRVDVDWDKVKLRDTFTWNYHDRVISKELFAAQLVEDLGLTMPAAEPVFEQVKHQIGEQLMDFYPPPFIEEPALDPELPYSAYKNDEMRILIKLNITIGSTTLEDKFEWDINNPLNSPEEFARGMSSDLSLSGEFTTAIAHCIREQSQLFTRSLYIVGHEMDGRPLEDADLVAAFLPSPIPSVFRPQQQAKEFQPYLYEITEADLERNEVIFSREQRRQKRSVNRRGGPTLPDLKDRQRTVRTLVVSSVLPGAAETVEDSRLYKRVGVPGRGKRGAAGMGDLTDSSDSEDSSPDSPAIQIQAGTARTRGIRGAATAAQQRMANIGRSETPESVSAHHHETRTSRRLGREIRDESSDPGMIIKLKIPRTKLKELERGLKIWTARLSSHRQTPTLTRAGSSVGGTPVPGAMGPPSTPGVQSQPLPAASTPNPQVQIGRVDAPPPPAPGQPAPQPPPPPAWLTQGLAALQARYEQDRFEGTMRYSAINTLTDTPTAMPQPGAAIPENVRFMYLPRIRCHDCPGKLYTPGPDTTVDNFEVHLKNRQHREKVAARKSAAGAGSSNASTGSS
ncbi:SNF5-domain-containing protein [Coleophoma cylindrospora]|uniref:SNF5-domain-containing protein n=1 Tax=Coleophoma cylindrospora TaxID=1849047 RepID=A0A3D8QCG7_9HELO|nr:SNF5-domain-containing protein [Coleophoma cylindrospora]